MIDGCLAYQRDGLNPPETVNKAGEDYRRSEDTLLDFIDEECIIDRNESCPAKHLYDRYKDWAKDGGIKPMTQTAFGRQIVALGFKRRKSAGVKIYDGIRLNTQVGLLVNQGQ
jgi:putative DNA primase/helicase